MNLNIPKTNLSRISLSFFTIIFWITSANPIIGQTVKYTQNVDQKAEIKKIKESSGNGIIVTLPKIYDDASLLLMLNTARNRLAALQVFDQTALTSKYGAVTGATLSQQSISGQITGSPIPQSVTSNVGLVNESTTTTQAAQSAAVPSVPANTAALPGSYSVSSLNILNEMMQLNYEITNLQLLLEGSLTDRYIKGERLIKSRTTVGFSITIQNPENFRDAVAILEVEATNPKRTEKPENEKAELPAVTAILPREKTYNVANISDKMMSFGGGIVTQVINGGFSYLSGRKNYFIVQDQDTLAMMQDSNTDSTIFAWQFRPVLGQRIVQAGLKQTFVQLAVPVLANQGCLGNLKIKTYWRKYDRKRNVLKEVIKNTIRISETTSLERYNQTPAIKDVKYDDLGSGNILATVEGQFLPGTYVRVGSNLLREGTPGFNWDVSQIRFTANASDIAKYRAYLVSRDGSENEIVGTGQPNEISPYTYPCISKPLPTPIPIRAENDQSTVNSTRKASFKLNVSDPSSYTLTSTEIENPDTKFKILSKKDPKSLELEIEAPNDFIGSFYKFSVIATLKKKADGKEETHEIPLIINSLTGDKNQPTIISATSSTYDTANSIVTVMFNSNFRETEPKLEDYIILIGGKVYGLSDAPITRNNNQLKVIVPTKTLINSPEIIVKPLLSNNIFSYKSSLSNQFPVGSSSERLIIYRTNPNNTTTYLLYGNRISDIKIKTASMTEIATENLDESTKDIMKLFTLNNQQISLKQIFIQKSAAEPPLILSLPIPKPTLGVVGTISAGSEEITIQGDGFDKLIRVTCPACSNGEIPKKVVGDKVTLSDLVKLKVTTNSGEKDLKFEFDGGIEVTLRIVIIDKKVEVGDSSLKIEISNKPSQ